MLNAILALLLCALLQAQTTRESVRSQEHARCTDESVWRTLVQQASDAELRGAVLQALGRVGHPSLRPLLSEQLTLLTPSDAQSLRAGAALGTALMGDVALLEPLSRSVSGAALAFAAGCVGVLPEGEAREAVLAALATEERSVTGHGAVQDALSARLLYGGRYADPELPRLIASVLTPAADAVPVSPALHCERLHAALFALQRSKTKPGKQWRAHLGPLLLHADERIAGRVARVLALLEDADAGDAAVIAAAFLEGARVGSYAQVERLRALAALPLDAAPCAALSQALLSKDVALERTAYETLAARASTVEAAQRAVFSSMARAAALGSPHVEVARAAAGALALLDAKAFLHDAKLWHLRCVWQVRAVAASAAAVLLPDSAAVAIVRRASQDADDRVRAALVEGCTTWLLAASKLTAADMVFLMSLAGKVTVPGEFPVPMSADPLLLSQWARLTEALHAERCTKQLGPAPGVTMLLTALRERVAQHEVEALQAAVDLAGVAGARAELQHWATCTEPSLRTRALALLQQRPLGVNPTAVAVRSNTATLVTKVSRPVASAPELITPAAGATAVATESQAVLLTTRGKITLTLFQKEAPATVANFVALTQRGFYDGIMFHRRVPGFVAQAGCPRGDGSGGPGHSIPCELNARTFKRGTLGMALAGKDTGGSQWFLCLADAPHLDGRYTVFGGVESGWDVMDALSEDDQILGIQILASAVR